MGFRWEVESVSFYQLGRAEASLACFDTSIRARPCAGLG